MNASPSATGREDAQDSIVHSRLLATERGDDDYNLRNS